MAPLVQDPKGYYGVLGLTPKADGAAVKRAYRTRAKMLHPDRNPSPQAVAEFQFLNEAYRVLSDPEARALYDRTPPPLAARVSGPGNGGRGRQRRRGPDAAPSSPQTAHAPNDGPLAPQVCRVCGRVTAQPRYLVLHRVRGLGFRVEQRPIRGVFCRLHGDRTAVAASLYCWGLGWWAIPWGPVRTLHALWRNLPGGERPAAENHHLLMDQARAFLARGNLPLARSLAEQGLGFARTPEERQNATRILDALADQPRLKPRDRGPWPGSAVLAQLAPLILIGVVALYVAGPTRVIGGLIAPLWPAAEDGPATTGAVDPPRVQGPFTGTTQPAVSEPSPETSNRTMPDASLSALPETPAPGRAHTPAKRTDGGAPTPVIGHLYAVRPSALAVRSGPGENYQVLATLSQDTVLMVTELSPDGRWGRVLSARGVSGFVPTDGLSPAAADLPAR